MEVRARALCFWLLKESSGHIENRDPLTKYYQVQGVEEQSPEFTGSRHGIGL